MAKTVDNRVVAMEFDNAVFQTKIADTLKSLDSLQKSLELAGAKHSLAEVGAAAQNVNLSSMAAGVESISSKFSAMGAVAFSVLSNITNKITDASLSFAKQFTMGPITDGFREMETKIGSVQTILANTSKYGTGLDEVEANLSALNDYSDKTIYNFGQMTKNIGLFTNAGIKIGDATSMIKGFSNTAAASGTTAEGAAGAAYQLSQALSAGKITLMDWRSLTNVGMGNANMKDGILEIAKAMGTLNDTETDAADIQKDFNGTLEKGWLTADVMSTYLKIMAGDMDTTKLKALGLSDSMIATFQAQQKTAEEAATKVRTLTQFMSTVKESIASGWSQTFELLLGGFEGSTAIFTGLYNAVNGFVGQLSDARNDLLKIWADFGARTTLIEAFKNVFASIGMVINGVRMAFRGLFPPATAEGLIRSTAAFSDFTIALREAIDKVLPKLVYIFAAVFSVIRVGYEIIKGITSLFVDLFKALIPDRSGSNLIGFFGNIGRAILEFNTVLINSGIVKFFDLLKKVLVPVARLIGNTTGKVIDFIFAFQYSEIFEAVISLLGKVGEAFAEVFSAIKDSKAVGDAIAFFEKLKDAIVDFFTAIDFTGILDNLTDRIGEFISKISELVGSFSYSNVLASTINLFGVLKDKIEDFFGSFGSSSGAMDATGKKIEDLSEKTKTFYKTIGAQDLGGDSEFLGSMLKDAKESTNILDSIKAGVRSFVDTVAAVPEKLGNIISGIKEKMGDFFKSFSIGNSNKAVDIQDILDTFNLLLVTGLLLTFRKMTKTLEQLSKSFVGIFNELGDTLKAFQTKVKAQALQAIAVALVLLVGALFVLSTIENEKLQKAFAAMTVGFAELVVVMKLLEKFGGEAKKAIVMAASMTLLATAMLLLATAIKILSSLDPVELAKGLGGVAIGLAILVTATRGVAANTAGLIAAGVAMTAFAVGVLVLSAAVLAFGNMNWDVMKQGLLGISVALAAIAVATAIMPATSMLAAGAAMIPLAIGLTLLAGAIQLFGTMEWTVLKQGLAAVAIGLALIGVAMTYMPPNAPMMAAGLILVGIALNIIAKAIQTLGGMEFEDVRQGILAVAALMVILAVGLNAMQSTLPGSAALLVAAAALVILAEVLQKLGTMRWQELALGLGAIAAVLLVLGLAAYALAATGALLALQALAIALLTLGAAFVLFGIGSALVVAALVYMVKSGQEHIGDFIDLLKELAVAIPEIIVIFAQNIAKGAEDLVVSAKKISDAVAQMIINALDGVIRVIPKIQETVDTLIVALIDTIATHLVAWIELGYKILLALQQGLLDNIGELTKTGIKIITEFLAVLAENMPSLVDSGIRMLAAFIYGIGSKIDKLIDAGTYVIAKFMIGLGQNAVLLAAVAGQVLIDFLNGLAIVIEEKAPEIRKAGARVALAILDGITGGLLDKAAIRKIVDKVKELGGLVVEGFKNVFGIESPSKVTAKMASQLGEGFAVGLDKDVLAQHSAVKQAERIVHAFQETLAKMPTGLPGIDDSPVITPVLDLSQVQAGAKSLNGLMAVSDISPTVSFDQARLISASTGPNESDPNSQNGSSPTEVNFHQTINAPQALTTNDIYRNTKSQFAQAKEELGIS